MNKNIIFLASLVATLSACTTGGLGTSIQADTVTLDVRCAADTDCPSGYQCEDETEHGVTTSYCVSSADEGTSTGACPAGYEEETEHATTFCKAHDGADDTAGGVDDTAGGGADDPADGGASSGSACTASADCAPGLECELDVEHGATTSICKAHGGNG